MNELKKESIPEAVIKGSAALLISAYTLRTEEDSVFAATIQACEYAKKYNIPVVLSLGTSFLIEAKREFFRQFTTDYVTVLAMNMEEAYAFEQKSDPLLACDSLLDHVDLVLLTDGARGLYVAGHCDKDNIRETNDPLVTKSIVNYNQFEYSGQ
jgi:inosine kinase